ncbi:TRIM3 [Branchiostoma lanceolatum]|uniref:TRIM3 protein n=1 Tax=Branchiostoma lanceolatum TaxID=7740 RepID=A0A8J9YMB3_BRALA|nr:TRIM3 [Branchiostoma lanceolatum]
MNQHLLMLQQDDDVTPVSDISDLQEDETSSGTAEFVFGQADNDDDPLTESCSLSRCNKDDDNDSVGGILTDTGAAAEIAPTVNITQADTMPYTVAYLCQDHMACMTTNSEETEAKKSYGKEKSSSNSNNDVSDCDESDNDTDTVENDGNAQNIRYHPNVLYPHTICLKNDRVQNQMYTQKALNPTSINSQNPNTMYAQNGPNCNPAYQPNVRNPNPMYAPNVNPELDELTSTEPEIAPTSLTTATSSGIVEATAEDLPSDVASGDAANGMAQASPDPETEEPASWQADIAQPYAVKYQSADDDDMATESNGTGNGQTLCVDIKPYAVRYGDDDDLPSKRKVTDNKQTQDVSPDNVDITPYAAAYMGQEDVVSEGNNDTLTIAAGCSSSMGATNASAVLGGHSEVRDVRNQAPQAPVYMPNGPQQDTCDIDIGTNPYLGSPCMLQLWKGDNAWPYVKGNDCQRLIWDNSANTIYVVKLTGDGRNEESKTITFGGTGREPGKFLKIFGVAVSADNEIFLPDLFNSRIQVYTMGGVRLRLFQTFVPGEGARKMQPSDVALDGEGHLWVVGKTKDNVKVVKYSRDGQPLSKFNVGSSLFFPSIAVDVTYQKVILTSLSGVLVFQPNGSLHLRFGEKRKSTDVTTDSEGNILLTVMPGSIQAGSSGPHPTDIPAVDVSSVITFLMLGLILASLMWLCCCGWKIEGPMTDTWRTKPVRQARGLGTETMQKSTSQSTISSKSSRREQMSVSFV